jgi:dihydroflavonol-4-reductase
MKVFVTGGTGFIGKNTVEHLIDSGHECVCFIRSHQKQAVLNDLGVQFAKGDVTDKQSLVVGMSGCDAVINLANLYSFWEPEKSLYTKVNVDGTRNVMEAALQAKILKVVHVSSIVTWGRSPDVPFNEDSPVGEHPTEYARTKYAGDKVAWELFENDALPLVMIYPGAVLGAGDTKATGNHINLLVNRKMPIRGLESTVFTFVHVDDVAEAIVHALDREGNIGEKYIIGNEQCTFGKINHWVSEIAGVPLPFLSIPNFMVKWNAFFLTALANLTKRPPLWGLSTDLVRGSLTPLKADGSKAERELGISYKPVRQAIEECIASFQQ